jgi:hypothetical protein
MSFRIWFPPDFCNKTLQSSMATINLKFFRAGSRLALFAFARVHSAKLRATSMIRRLILVLSCLAVTSCQSPEVVRYAAIDDADRSIVVPPGNRYLLGPLKEELQRQGFTTVVPGNWTRIDEEADIIPVIESKARYRLYLEQRLRDVCLTGSPRVAYTLSIVDLEQGNEVLRSSGQGCAPSVARRIAAALVAPATAASRR